jgi:hypothetical protein
MNEVYLRRWQANALAEALWATHQPRTKSYEQPKVYYRPWQSLPPKLPLHSSHHPTVVERAEWRNTRYVPTGQLTLYDIPAKTPGPRYLPVRVPQLEPLNIPQHEVVVTYYDYEACVHHMAVEDPDEFKAWCDYVQKSRLSAVFQSAKDGKRQKVYWSVRQARDVTKVLVCAVLRILEVADAPNVEDFTLKASFRQKRVVSADSPDSVPIVSKS